MNKIVAALLLTLLAACASKTEYHVPPTGDAAASAASVVGTRIYRVSDFEGDARVSVLGVDGKHVSSEKGIEGWDEAVLIAPGPHELMIILQIGSFDPLVGFGMLEADLAPGERYKLVATYPDGDLPSTIWLETAAGERASDKIAVAANAPHAAPVVIFLP